MEKENKNFEKQYNFKHLLKKIKIKNFLYSISKIRCFEFNEKSIS